MEEERETVMASKYEVAVTKPSKYIKGTNIEYIRGMRCPRCNTVNRRLNHGEAYTCKQCNLHMQLFGNALRIWEGEQ